MARVVGVGKLAVGREEPEREGVLGAVGAVESDDVGVDVAVGIVVGPGGGAVGVGLGGVPAVTVLEGVEQAGRWFEVVADSEEVACPLGGAALRECEVLADEFEQVATVASGVVVPEALLGAGEFDVAGVARVTEDVADDPLVSDLTAGGEELRAEVCDTDGECVREFCEGHACRCERSVTGSYCTEMVGLTCSRKEGTLSVVLEVVLACFQERDAVLFRCRFVCAAEDSEPLVVPVCGFRRKV